MGNVRVELPVDDAYDLNTTLSVLTMGRGNPCLQHTEATAAMVHTTPEGVAVVRADRVADALSVTVEGDGAEWIEPHLSKLFGLFDHSHQFQPTGKLRRLAAQYVGLRLPTLPAVFPRLVQVVLQQLISFRDACRGWRLLVLRHGEKVAEELYAPPTAKRLARLTTQEFIECEILPRHGRTIRGLAQQAAGIERLWAAGADAEAVGRVSEFLLRQPGVGPWTVGYLRGAGLGDADAVVLGDYGHPHQVPYFFTGEERGDDEQMVELLEPYRPHRFRALMLLILGARNVPRRGPKRTPLRRRFR